MIDVPVTTAIRNPSAISAGTAANPSADDRSSWRRRPRSTRSRYRMLIDSTSRLESATGPTARRSAAQIQAPGKGEVRPEREHPGGGHAARRERDDDPAQRAAPGAGRLGERVGQPDHAQRETHRRQREQRRQPRRRVIVVERHHEDEGADAPGGVGDGARAPARQHEHRQPGPQHEQRHQRVEPEVEQRLVGAARAQRARDRLRTLVASRR